MQIGVLLPNWVGDLAMATPALRLLRKHHCGARIVGVARPHLIPLLDGTTWLDAIHPWEHKGRGRIARTWKLVNQLRADRLDLLVLLRASLSAGIVGRLSGATHVIGYARRGLGWLVTDPVVPPGRGPAAEPVSAVDAYLHLMVRAFALAALGRGDRRPSRASWDLALPDPSVHSLLASRKQLELATTAKDEAAADGLWQRLGLPPGNRVMLLNTGGAYGQAKHWPAEYCVSLALRAADEFGLTTLVLCGPQERQAAAAIENAARHPQVCSLAQEDVSFGTTKAIIRRSRLLVTTDSGPRHIASALGTPTIVLFGPIDPRWSRNYQRDSIELSVPLDCAPCGRRVCPLGHHRCMRDLTVDQVLKAVATTLGNTKNSREAA